jgi:energy-converting hydrogenase A subunit M
MSPEGEPMAELSEGLDLSNVGATTREVQGITSTAMDLTGLESLHTAHEAARPAQDCA